MSQILRPPTGGTPANPNNVYGPLGHGTGGGTTVTGAGTNTKGSATAIGTTSAAWAGFFIDIGMGSTSVARFLFDLSFDNGTTWHCQNIFTAPGTTGAYSRIFIPMNVASGAQISARLQSSVASASLNMSLLGVERNAASAPMFSTMTSMNIDTANTRPSTGVASADVPLTNVWVEMVASTASAFGFIVGIMSDNGTIPTTAQGSSAAIGVGASGSQVEIVRWGMQLGSAVPTIRNSSSPAVYRSIPSGSKLWARAQAATTGDSLRQALYGFGV